MPKLRIKIKCPETIIGRNVNCPKCKSGFIASISNDPLILRQVELENKPSLNNFNDPEMTKKKAKSLDKNFVLNVAKSSNLKPKFALNVVFVSYLIMRAYQLISEDQRLAEKVE